MKSTEQLKKELRSIRMQLAENAARDKENARKLAEKKKIEKIKDRIKRLGGTKRFIANYGRGIKEDQTLLKGPETCSVVYGDFHSWNQDECAYLGVPPNLYKTCCLQRGKYIYEGKRYCGIHMKLIFSRGYQRGGNLKELMEKQLEKK